MRLDARDLADDMLTGRTRKHSLRVGDSLTGLAATVGYLHDTVEEKYLSGAAIRYLFDDYTADAVLAMSRQYGETYAQFIKRAAAHPVAGIVKLADMLDNLEEIGTLKSSLSARYLKQLPILLKHLPHAPEALRVRAQAILS